MTGVIAMQHAVHHSKSGQESASQQERKVAKEKMRNRSVARPIPVQVCTCVFFYVIVLHVRSLWCFSHVVPMNDCVTTNNNVQGHCLSQSMEAGRPGETGQVAQ